MEEDEILTILVKAATDILKQTCTNNSTYFLFRCKKMKHVINKIDSGGGGGGAGGGAGSGGHEGNEGTENASSPFLDVDNVSFIKFHENIEIVRKTGIEQVFSEYSDDVTSYLTCSFGVLLFLYSVMLTRVRTSLKIAILM